MPKMIKVTMERPSNSVGWGIVTDENPGADIVDSYNNLVAKTNYDSADPAAYVGETNWNSPDDLHAVRYFKFDDYPATTPADLATWFWKKRRAIDLAGLTDAEVTVKDPITGNDKVVKYNKYQKWMTTWMADKGIKFVSYEEVDHDFPA